MSLSDAINDFRLTEGAPRSLRLGWWDQELQRLVKIMSSTAKTAKAENQPGIAKAARRWKKQLMAMNDEVRDGILGKL